MRRRPISLAAALCLALVTGTVAALTTGLIVDHVVSRSAQGQGIDLASVSDGADPTEATCNRDERVTEAHLFNAPDNSTQRYEVQFLSSKRCGALWARVTRFDSLTKDHSMHVDVYEQEVPTTLVTTELPNQRIIDSPILLDTSDGPYCVRGWIQRGPTLPDVLIPNYCS